MNTDQLEEAFARWSASQPDLIHSVWDMTNGTQLVGWLLQQGYISVGPKQLNSVEEAA